MKNFITDNKDNITTGVALAAFVLSIFNSIHSFIVARRDRENLKTELHLFKAYERDGRKYPRSITIKAVNSGRRALILTVLGADYDNGTQGGTMLNHPNGITLNEKEQYSADFADVSNLLCNVDDDGESRCADNLWFEDTLGTKFYVKGAKKRLKAFWKQG
jgi:hypothetical protein